MGDRPKKMIRAAIVGDTHGRINNIEKKLREEKIDYLLFTGDYFNDGQRLSSKLKIGFEGVAGNCDPSSAAAGEEKIIRLAGKRLYLTHGHHQGVKRGINSLYYRGIEQQADAIIYGHTHVPLCQQVNGIWVLNPGSPSRPRAGQKGSFILLQAGNNLFIPKIVYLSN